MMLNELKVEIMEIIDMVIMEGMSSGRVMWWKW